MKPLILLTLLFAATVTAQAQATIADLARQARKEKADQPQATKVIHTEDIRGQGGVSAGPSVAVGTPPRSVENPAPATEKTVEKTAAPEGDPVQKWVDAANKARARVSSLMDQETANQAEINKATSDINAPVTSQSAKDEAQKKLEAAQKRQAVIKNDLTNAQAEVRALDQQGPPVKKPQ